MFAKVLNNRHVPWLLATFGSLLGAIVCYRLWNANLGIPFSYRGDGFSNAMAFKAVVENGTIWSNPYLAAPFAQHYQDWPLTDLLPIYVAKALSIFSSNWAALQNVVYILQFPAIGAASWWVMRKLGVSAFVAAVLSILYSLAPYHFGRGAEHFFLSGYFGVPLGVWLAMSLLSGAPLFTRRAGEGRFKQFLTLHNLRVVLIAVAIVASSIYYAVFTAVLLVTALLVVAFRRRWDLVIQVLAVFVAMGLTFALLAAPTFAYRAEHGPNVLGAKRLQSDTETYGLKLSQMILPTDGHRIDEFSELRGEYIKNFPLPSEHVSTALGVVASFGLLFLLYLVAKRLIVRSTGPTTESNLALLMLVALITASVGGFATLISLLLTSQVRGWNRMSIVIAFLALTAVGLLIDRLARNYRLFGNRAVSALLLFALLGVGVIDQYGRGDEIPFAENRAAFLDDADFFNQIEATVPKGTRVFQLPRTQFPEPTRLTYNQMDAYDPMRPYLHTQNIYWSYGGIEGRLEADWQSRLHFKDIPKFLDEIVAGEFTGLYIDRFAYTDRAQSIEHEVTTNAGVEPMVSRNDRMSFFDLRAFSRLRHQESPQLIKQTRERLFFPITHQVSDPQYRTECSEVDCFVWAPEDVTIPLNNVSGTTQQATVSFSVATTTSEPHDLLIKWPDGASETRTVSGTSASIGRTMQVKKGKSELRIDTELPALSDPIDKRERSFRIIEMAVEPD